MANPTPFGRRTTAEPAVKHGAGRGPGPIPAKRHAAPKDAAVPVASDPVEAELQAWKAGRTRPAFPWRSFSLMASLCFGAASFVLPASVNDAVSWILYGLAAISFFVGLRRRRKTA